MTQRVCFSLMWGLVHGPTYYKSDMMRYVCSFLFLFLLFLTGGYSCSWMVTNDPGVTLPPHRGRVSGTQGQRWWVLLLLGTAGPPTPVSVTEWTFIGS